MKEHGIQNTIRNDLVPELHCFRANVGTGWQGEGKPYRVKSKMVVAVNPGDVVLRKARPFSTGLPEGFHDLFGFAEVEITPAMVGQKFARFMSFEVKTETGRASQEQTAFRHAVNNVGGVSGIVRSSADALALVRAAKAGHTCH